MNPLHLFFPTLNGGNTEGTSLGRRLLCGVFLFALIGSSAETEACFPQTARNAARQADRDRPAPSSRRPPLSPERREELLEFIREHHPELEKLLLTLERKRPPRFQSALRGIDATVTRLDALRDDPERYETALEDWKLKSRIELLAARIAIEDRPEWRDQLTVLIESRLQRRQEQLQTERERLEKRLERLNQQLAKIDDDEAAEVERQVTATIRRLRNSLGVNRNRDRQNAPALDAPPKKGKGDDGGGR